MSILEKLLTEVYNREGSFSTEDDLIRNIKSILRRTSIPRHSQTKASSEKGFALPTKVGYKYQYLNGIITVSFPLGAERSWIGEVTKEFSKADIIFHYNESKEIFLIKVSENLKPEDVTPIKKKYKNLEDIEEEIVSESKHNIELISGKKYYGKYGVGGVVLVDGHVAFQGSTNDAKTFYKELKRKYDESI